MDAQGRIDVLRTPPATDQFAAIALRRDAPQSRAYGHARPDARRRRAHITLLLEALPEHIEDASVDTLWSRGNTLRRRHDAHVRTVDNNLGPDPARLHSLVGERLGDVIDSFNVFIIGDPRGLELDRIRLGPQDREAARKIVALAAPIALAASEPKSPATSAAQETLTEQVRSAIDAPNDINGDQATELARRTTGNFVSKLLLLGAVAVTAVGTGFYHEAGAAAFKGLSDAYGPEILSFVVRNAEALRAFVQKPIKIPNLLRSSI